MTTATTTGAEVADVSGWSFADIFETVAATMPDAPCQVQGDRVLLWRDVDRMAGALASFLRDAGLDRQAKVAVYLYNCPEFLTTYYAAFKASLVPLNVNYRYGPDEIAYILQNSDAEAVVFHSSFTPVLDKLRDRLPAVKAWVCLEDGDQAPTWGTSFTTAVADHDGAQPSLARSRSGDDLLLLYTGGTTGLPKGVMWRQADVFQALGGGGSPITGAPPVATLEELAGRLAVAPPVIAACPLMHGVGQFAAMQLMVQGAAVVTVPERTYDPAALLDAVVRHRAGALILVGDAFARPLLEALDSKPGGWDTSSLMVIISSGVMWSEDVKKGLMRHLPTTLLVDSLGASEGIGMAISMSGGGNAASTGAFTITANARVITEDGRFVEPGSGERGMVGLAGAVPLGYYNDDELSARTFRVIDGVRYSIPGDWAEVGSDGQIRLLGRGSGCINTGGEKVFAEEVEEALKLHPDVADAAVIGLPDPRLGSAVTAVVQRRDGASTDSATLIDHVKSGLASYKAPRAVVFVDAIGRTPSGKVDYPAVRAAAEHALAD